MTSKTKKRVRMTDLENAKRKGVSVAELKYPNSKEVAKAVTKQSKVKWPEPHPCEHDKIDYKAMQFMAKQQLIIIKQLTKQIADMEEKFHISQQGVTELTDQYTTEIDRQNAVILGLHTEINRIVTRRAN